MASPYADWFKKLARYNTLYRLWADEEDPARKEALEKDIAVAEQEKRAAWKLYSQLAA